MFITTIAAYVILRKLTAPPPIEDIEENATPSTSGAPDTEDDEGPSYTFEHYILLKRTGKLNHLKCLRSVHVCDLISSRRNICIGLCFSDFLCNVYTSGCCHSSTIRSECDLFYHIFANRNRVGAIQRNRSRFCHSLSSSCRFIGDTYQRTVGISNPMATGISRCQ